jgi:hypothetical protein
VSARSHTRSARRLRRAIKIRREVRLRKLARRAAKRKIAMR